MFNVTASVISFLPKFVHTANFSTEIFYQAPSAVAIIFTHKFYYNTVFFCEHRG